MTDELSWVVDHNERVRRLRAIIDSARPHVSLLVGKVFTNRFDKALQPIRRRAVGGNKGACSTPRREPCAPKRFRHVDIAEAGNDALIGERGLERSSTAGKLGRGARKALDPERELRAARAALEDADTVGNHVRLAQAAAALGRWDDAAQSSIICGRNRGNCSHSDWQSDPGPTATS